MAAISITIQVLHGMTDGEAIVHFTPLWNSAIAVTYFQLEKKKEKKKGERSGKEILLQ